MTSRKWDRRFLDLAAHIAQWSKDPGTQVGAVVVRPNKTVLSVGYNGLPRGIADDPHLLRDRDYKLARTVHAEMNALAHSPERPAGCTVYVHPIPPCSNCAAMLVQMDVARVVSPVPSERWRESCHAGRELLKSAGVHVDWMEGAHAE